jgi:hypothetical protein
MRKERPPQEKGADQQAWNRLQQAAGQPMLTLAAHADTISDKQTHISMYRNG